MDNYIDSLILSKVKSRRWMLLVEIIYEQLKTPKSVEELHQRLNEAGVK